jgi:hypothetical protein
MKLGFSKLALAVALAGAAAPAALAQQTARTPVATPPPVPEQANQFDRTRYQEVATRPQPEFDPEPVTLGGFTMDSNLGVSARFNDNIFATQGGKVDDVIVEAVPTVNLRSNWRVHELSMGATVDHREYLDNGDESATDYNAFLRGRLDVTRDFNFGGSVSGAHITEGRYAPASQGGGPQAEYDRVAFEASANYLRDRIQLNGYAGSQEDQFDEAIYQFRDVTETYYGGRASFAVSPAVAVFVQARQSDLDYDFAGTLLSPSRDATRTTIAGGFNFELSAPFRGDVAIGYVEEDKDSPTLQDTDGVSVDARLQWFPTDLTTVTFTGARTVFDPGLPNSSSAFYTLFGVHVDHELRRNLILFGGVSGGTRDYQDINREDDLLNADVGLAWKLNKHARVETTYTYMQQDVSGLTGADFDINVLSVGIRVYP